MNTDNHSTPCNSDTCLPCVLLRLESKQNALRDAVTMRALVQAKRDVFAEALTQIKRVLNDEELRSDALNTIDRIIDRARMAEESIMANL